MAAKTKDTQKSASKVVRSHLSQAYQNAKEGKFVDGNLSIEPTRLEEPTALISESNLPIDSDTHNKISPSGLKHMGSVNLSLETISDLIALLDMRELEKWTDGWIAAGLTSLVPAGSGNLDLHSNNALEELNKVKRILNHRSDFVFALDKFIINSQRRKILSKRPTANVRSDLYTDPLTGFMTRFQTADDDSNDVYTYLNFSNLFSPHFMTDLEQGLKEKLNRDQSLNSLLALTTTIPLEIELQELFKIYGGKGHSFRLDNRYSATSAIRSLIAWTAACIDYGYTPNYIVDGFASTGERQYGGYSIGAKFTASTEFPTLMEMGMYRAVNNNPVFSIVPNQLFVMPQIFNLEGQSGVHQQPVPPHSTSYPNLRVGHDLNPAVNIKRQVQRIYDAGATRPRFGREKVNATIMTLAHVVSMLRSESLQSAGLHGNSGEGDSMPSFASRSMIGNFGIPRHIGVGSSFLGSPDHDALRAGRRSEPEKAVLSEIVSEGFTTNALPSASTTFLPFEKGLVLRGDTNLSRDLYNTHLKQIFSRDTQEEERRNRIDSVAETFHDKVTKTNSGMERVLALFADGLRDKEKLYTQNNIPTGLPDRDSSSGNPAEIFGKIISRPVQDLVRRFRENQSPHFPFDYWSSRNANGIQNDRAIIAQTAALMYSVSLPSSTGNNLRSAIVEAIVSRDLRRSMQGTTTDTPRNIGYHRSIANRQSVIIRNKTVPPVFGLNFTPAPVIVSDGLEHSVIDILRRIDVESLQDDMFGQNPAHLQGLHGLQEEENNVTDLRSLQISFAEQQESSFGVHPEGAQDIRLTFDMGVDPVSAVGKYSQGGIDRSYRVTKYSTIDDFVGSVLGRNLSFDLDIYDMIISEVDRLDRSLSTSHALSGNNASIHVDGSFNSSVQANLGIQEGNYSPESGITRANAFDRTSLISIVVDFYARIFESTFTVKAGTTETGVRAIREVGGGPHVVGKPFVLELFTGNFRDEDTQLGRNRGDHYFVNVPADSFLGNANAERMYIPNGASASKWQHRARFFTGIESVASHLNLSVAQDKDSRTVSGLSSLILRTSANNGQAPVFTVPSARGCVIPIHSSHYEQSGQTFNFDHTEELLGVVPSRPFGNAPKITANPEGGMMISATGRDLFTYAFQISPSSPSALGMMSYADYAVKVAEAMFFLSAQDGAPVRGMLALSKYVNEYHQAAKNLKIAKNIYRDHETEYAEDTSGGEEILPRDISKSQIVSKQNYVRRAEMHIQKAGSGVFSPLTGGYTYEAVKELNRKAKMFLEFQASQINTDAAFAGGVVKPKTFHFYGVEPNLSIESIIASGDALGEPGFFTFEKSTNRDQKQKYKLEVEMNFKAESGINPDINYTNSGESRHQFDIQHRILERDVIRCNATNYMELAEKLELIKINDLSGNIAKNAGLYREDISGAYRQKSRAQGLYAPGVAAAGVVSHHMRDKLDSFFLKYIMQQCYGISFDEKYLGLNCDILNESRFKGLSLLIGIAEEALADATQAIQPSEIRDHYFEPIDDFNNFVKQRPYDDKFKRDLQPRLEREEDSSRAVLVTPRLNNNEIIAAQILRNSNVARSYMNLGEIAFDEVFAVDFNSDRDMRISTEDTPESYFDPETSEIKDEYSGLTSAGGLYIVNPNFYIRLSTSAVDAGMIGGNNPAQADQFGVIGTTLSEYLGTPAGDF